MTWELRYRLRQRANTSLMLPAALALLLAIVTAMAMRIIDSSTGWKIFDYSPEGARAVLSTFVGSMLTFIVFVLSATLIVVQLASGQFSPRVVSIIFARPAIKWTLGMLTFAFTYSLASLARVDERVMDFHVGVGVLLNLVCILGFFYFAQALSLGLRPYSLIQHIAVRGKAVINQVYPKPYDAAKAEQSGSSTPNLIFDSIVIYNGGGGTILAFSVGDLVRIARDSETTLQLMPQVGDYVAQGDPLFRHTATSRPPSPAALHGCVAVGQERTLDQDPRFLFRILVDIAAKALSPAINDPTTAVIALDQIDNMLLRLGRKHLGDGLVKDESGKLRLVFGTPDWPDFVMLAATEIRHYGDTSLQVVRRLRAMLDNLVGALPEARRPALAAELTLLDAAVKRRFPDELDCQRAREADYQGIGGSES